MCLYFVRGLNLNRPSITYVTSRKSVPALTGWYLVFSVYAMEWIRPIREKIWWGAGFGSLRAIRFAIEEYEPLAEITVVPLETETVSNGTAHHQEPAAEIKAVPRPTNGYYSAAKYRELYLSGELTPTDVAHAILPLIRRDIEPKGSHHLAWIDSKVDIVLQSAAASTERYKEGRSLGPLDGVPCGVKDEYDMDGYRTTLGSANDYTPEVKEVDSMNSWCIQKLLEAGVIIVGKTSMVEFGLGKSVSKPNLKKACVLTSPARYPWKQPSLRNTAKPLQS